MSLMIQTCCGSLANQRVNSPRLARVPRMSPSAEALERSEGEAKGQTYDYHRRSDDQR